MKHRDPTPHQRGTATGGGPAGAGTVLDLADLGPAIVDVDQPDFTYPGDSTESPEAVLAADVVGSDDDNGEAAAPVEIVWPPRLGPNPNRRPFGRRSLLSFQEQGAPTTTRQAEVLNTAIVGSPSNERGVIVGLDKLSGALIAHDPITAYGDNRVSSPNVIILGALGVGKSTLVKTCYVERPLLLEDRAALVIDKKLQGGEGEYAELTRRFGFEPFRFDPDDADGHTRTILNVMDPVILSGGGAATQRQLLTAMAELSGGTDLDEWEHKATTAAYRLVRRDLEDGTIGRDVAVLQDLTARFIDVVDTDEMRRWPPAVRDRMAIAAASMQWRYERLIDDDLAGMFDGETSSHVRLNPKLTTFDVSALPDDGPAVSMVMLIANAWLMGLLTRQTKRRRINFIAEEGWHLLGGPGGKVIQSKSKLARGLGLSLIAAIHHVSDIPAGTPGAAMIKEAETVHLFRQDKGEDIAECIQYFNLEASNAEGLASLGVGEHLLKVGNHREIRVQHLITAKEFEFTETNSALVRQPAAIPAEPPPPELVKTP